MTAFEDTIASAKQKVAGAVDGLADDLEALSHRIHDNPELCFKEEKAHAWLAEFLEKHGAQVERSIGGLPTAFRATINGAGAGPTIAILAEYDAASFHRSRVRPQRHRDGRHGRRGGARSGPRPDPVRGPHPGDRHPGGGRRRGQGAPAWRPASFADVDAGDDDPRPVRDPGVATDAGHHQGEGRVPRQGDPRLLVAVARRERAERRSSSSSSRSTRCASSSDPTRARPRHHRQGRRPAQHHPRVHARRLLSARPHEGLLPGAAPAVHGLRRRRRGRDRLPRRGNGRADDPSIR